MLCGSLSPWHGTSSFGCGWRTPNPDLEGSCEYIEYAATDSREGVVAQLGGWVRG